MSGLTSNLSNDAYNKFMLALQSLKSTKQLGGVQTILGGFLIACK